MLRPAVAMGVSVIATGTAVVSMAVAQPCPGLAFGEYAQELPFFGTGVPHSLATGDLNTDGFVDAVVSGSNAGVAFYAGIGGGLLADAVEIETPIEPYNALIEDLDLDGRNDLILRGHGGFAIHYGRADGTLDEPLHIPVETIYGGSAGGLATADLNGDGERDLVGALHSDDRIVVLLGLGNRQFGPEISTPVDTPAGLDAADITEDGIDDIVVALFLDAELLVLQSNGDGTFHEEHRLATLSYPAAVRAVALSGDSILDIIVDSRFEDEGIVAFYGMSSGGFFPAMYFEADVSNFAGNNSPTVIDLDGDGHLDIVSGAGLSGASVLLGQSDRRFLLQREYSDRIVLAQSTASADMNLDGIPDVLVASYFPQSHSSGLLVVENICDEMCSGADMAHPTGTQDIADVATFIEFFTSNDPIADLNRDDLNDLADIVMFVSEFASGCP